MLKQIFIVLLLTITVLMVSCSNQDTKNTNDKSVIVVNDNSINPPQTTNTAQFFTPAKTQSTNTIPILPDSKLTPGDIIQGVTAKDICVSGYSGKVRNVPQSIKDSAYKEYGIISHKTGEYEVDHLISLELGGSNSIKNLWAESYITSPYNAHIKDKLENKMHSLVCSGKLDLSTAQKEISTDWISAYNKYVVNKNI